MLAEQADERVDFDRLPEEVLHAERACFTFDRPPRARRHRDGDVRERRVGELSAAEREAVHLGHRDVEDDEARSEPASETFERFAAVMNIDHVNADSRADRPERLTSEVVVLDEEDDVPVRVSVILHGAFRISPGMHEFNTRKA